MIGIFSFALAEHIICRATPSHGGVALPTFKQADRRIQICENGLYNLYVIMNRYEQCTWNMSIRRGVIVHQQ